MSDWQAELQADARTLEDLDKEMLRPMLKSWLDDNLPSLVERIVKAEIERVSRGHCSVDGPYSAISSAFMRPQWGPSRHLPLTWRAWAAF